MENQGNKRQFLETLKMERARWEALLAEVGEARMERGGVTGEWSVKDIIAHIVAWESRPIAWLAAIKTGTTPEPPGWPTDRTEEQINAWIYNGNRGRSLADILADSRRSYDRVLEGLQSSPEDVFAQSYPWLRKYSLWDGVAGNTYEHYREHGELIRSWLKDA